MSYEPLVPARPTQTEQGVAVHPDYGDVYHSLSGAMGQADYVFLQGNGLPCRWQGQAQFTICETGFGLGNNFLTTWHRWRHDPQRSQRLHFLSFEAHPLPRADLARQLQRSPAVLQPLAQQLLAVWPYLLPGVHRLEFERGQVSLTLVFGRIEQTARVTELRADAFFLDGFSPRLNPAMWTPSLFAQLVRMAAQGATLATWCTASAVRRALQNAGFVLEKRPGFAFKREMLIGQLRPHLGQKPPVVPIPQRVAVVGGGIVGAATAAALVHRGVAVTVFDPAFRRNATGPLELGAAHAGHAAVAMVPLLARQDPARARLSRLGLELAVLRWGRFLGQHWFLTPTVQLPSDAAQARYDRHTLEQLAFDPQWVDWYDGGGLSQFIGGAQARADRGQLHELPRRGVATALQAVAAPYGAWYFHQSYVVRPAALIAALLQHPLITPIGARVQALRPQNQGWRIKQEEHSHEADAVVIANAAGAQQLLSAFCRVEDYPRFFRAQVVQGQVGIYPRHSTSWPETPIFNGPGYLLSDRQGSVVLGSSYQRTTAPVFWSSTVQNSIENRLRSYLGAFMPTEPAQTGWVGQRLATPDHRPIMGPVGKKENALWLATAMGSYGFSWASVAAEYIAADLLQEPQVLTLDLQRAVALR